MSGPLTNFLAGDHARLDGLLRRAMIAASTRDRAASAEFRAGLLKHISLEEKILLPAAQRWQGGDPLPIAAKLRLDHGALAALLVPTPTPAIIAGHSHRPYGSQSPGGRTWRGLRALRAPGWGGSGRAAGPVAGRPRGAGRPVCRWSAGHACGAPHAREGRLRH